MYHLIRQHGAIAPRTFKLTFHDPGVRAYVFDLRLIEHDDVRDEDASRFGLDRRVGQVRLDA